MKMEWRYFVLAYMFIFDKLWIKNLKATRSFEAKGDAWGVWTVTTRGDVCRRKA